MIVLIGNHYLSLISDKDIILFVINILFIKTISKLILKILALPNLTQKYSQEYSQLTSTYLEETINQTSVIGQSEIEQFMEVQERIKCDGNSVFHDFIKFFFKCIINCYYKIYTYKHFLLLNKILFTYLFLTFKIIINYDNLKYKITPYRVGLKLVI